MNNFFIDVKKPSIDDWLREAKEDPESLQEGMYLVHNGIVRQTPKVKVRQGIDNGSQVVSMEFSYDEKKVDQVIKETSRMQGIFHIKVWLNKGILNLGDDIMYILIGGDIRPHVIDALQFLVGKIKNECVIEIEKRV
ncbi:MAG: molybdenum cofactor biosynthesis protein MoaE [Clostridiales bacterium]|nr:molybdenum cofactor biosynthesis protein MoaE [Clostridiales bacterium]